jgi:photosystem II stability/assembly factor-like uncharacterized protein
MRCPERVSAGGIHWVNGFETVWVAGDCGLMRSADRGATWEQVIVDPEAMGIADIWDSRFRPDRMFSVLSVDGSHLVAGGESGHYYSSDGGRSWRRSVGAAPNVYCVRGVAGAPTDSRLLFRTDYDTAYLQYSIDQGMTWRNFPQPDLGAGNIAPWVRTAPISGSVSEFELYFGNGVGLKRARLSSDVSTWSRVRFEDLSLAHADPQDIALYPTTQRPYLLAGDGGVLNTRDDGASWSMVGAGPRGLNALEVYGLAAQHVRSPERNVVSFVTWHNDTWVSLDGAATWMQRGPVEGFAIHASGPEVNDDSEALMSVQPWGGSGRLYNSVSGADVTDPTPRDPGCYRHYTFFRDPADGKQNILASSYGCEGSAVIYDRRATDRTTWREVGRPAVGRFVGFPQTATTGGRVTIYHVYQNDAGNNVFVRTRNVTGTATTDLPAMRDFGSVAQMLFNGQEPVWAVKPDDENVLIAADATSQQMMISRNGGDDWTPLYELTELVIDYGRLRFITERQSQATTIAFHPLNSSMIVVGTVKSGLLVSRNGGMSWGRVSGSDDIANITTVAFGRNATYFGTSGRGLWSWRVEIPRPPNTLVQFLDQRIVRDPSTGARVPIEIIGDPDRCPACVYVVASRGTIASATYDPKRRLVITASDPEAVVIYSAAGSPSPLIMKSVRPGKFASCPACTAIGRQGQGVRALVFEKDTPRAFVASDEKGWTVPVELLTTADPGKRATTTAPRVSFEGVVHGPGFDMASQGASIAVIGSDFRPDGEVIVLVNGKPAGRAKADAKGSFRQDVLLNTRPGEGSITCLQVAGEARLRAEKALLIQNHDAAGKH